MSSFAESLIERVGDHVAALNSNDRQAVEDTLSDVNGAFKVAQKYCVDGMNKARKKKLNMAVYTVMATRVNLEALIIGMRNQGVDAGDIQESIIEMVRTSVISVDELFKQEEQ